MLFLFVGIIPILLELAMNHEPMVFTRMIMTLLITSTCFFTISDFHSSASKSMFHSKFRWWFSCLKQIKGLVFLVSQTPSLSTFFAIQEKNQIGCIFERSRPRSRQSLKNSMVSTTIDLFNTVHLELV